MIRFNIRQPLYRLTVPIISLLALASTLSIAPGQNLNMTSRSPDKMGSPTPQVIIQDLVQHNRERALQLKGYTDQRHYTVTYHGFPAVVTAGMLVQATYDAPITKRFQIISQTGSKLLNTKVLTRLLDSEKEAALDPDRTALTPANYTFTLLGEQEVMARKCYVFHVEPKVESKFLYRGKIYVDAQDYAVTQIDAEPAKNPSFFIKQVHIHHVYAKTGPFWLPQSDRSETTLRFGGTAVLTIDYGTYRVQSAASH